MRKILAISIMFLTINTIGVKASEDLEPQRSGGYCTSWEYVSVIGHSCEGKDCGLVYKKPTHYQRSRQKRRCIDSLGNVRTEYRIIKEKKGCC